MPNVRERVRVPELMDDPALDPKLHAHALAGLRRVNRLSRSDAILWPELHRLAVKLGRPIRIVDIATGSGDVPIRLAQRFAKARLPVTIHGCDISETAVAEARGAASGTVDFFVHNILATPLQSDYDAVICSLFMHHLDPPDAELLLKRMADGAKHLVLVNDLQRSWLGWWAAYIGTRLLTRSPIVHYDGPVSVAAAFTPKEAIQMAANAGLPGATARRCFPWRFLLKWERPSG